MTEAERFREVDRLFQEVCDLAPGARADRLVELAPADEALRSEVLELLAAEARADASHGLTPAALQAEIGRALGAGGGADEDPQELAGYRILSRLGAGGMGVVYEAEQRSPRRTVALKVLRPGLATPELVRRFEFEAEALGRLRHPGVAQVYEAGVAQTGAGPRPFFAMELVRGVPLDAWARSSAASARERLEKMARVCDAVQHAHAQGVIHRDLKPANILVTPEGDPKVVDFGVARTVGAEARADSLQTVRGQLVGTVPYMSPEQLSGETGGVDTRSDVYALGVVLFELMSGRLPHDVAGRGLVEAARTIQEREPTRLAALEPRLRGDVDTIVGKALERDKERRYATAAAMADDLRRHLAGLTISARPPSAMYQLSRLARRHVPAAVAACVALAALVGAVIVVSFALAEAVSQRDMAKARQTEAERQTALAQGVTSFLNEDVLAAVTPEALGHGVTVREAIDAAAGTIGARFAGEPATGAAIRNNIGNVYVALGEFAAAEPLLVEARDMFARELGEDHELTLAARQDLGSLYSRTARFTEAREAFRDVLARREATAGPASPATLKTLVLLAELERDGFHDLGAAGRWLAEFESRRAGVLADDHPTALHAALAGASLAAALGDFEAAADGYERVARAREVSLGPDHATTLSAWHNYAYACEALGRYDEAEPIYERALEFELRQGGPDNPDTLVTAHNLAFLYESMGRYDEAEPLYVDTLARCERVFGPVHPGTLTCAQSLSSLYRQTGRDAEALELLERTYQSARTGLGPGAPPVVEIGWKLGVVYVELGRNEDAVGVLGSILPHAREMFPPDHPLLGSMLSSWGESLARVGRYEEAREALSDGFAILDAAGGAGFESEARTAARRLAGVHRALGDAQEADRWAAAAGEPDPTE